jgi:RNA polymerase sigma factor (sigma-70 family)
MTPLLSTPLLRAQSDRRLTALAGNGHDRAFEEIVERYRRPLQRYLRRLLSEALAEDVLQATFVRAWQALRAGTEVRDLRPWLYRIAHNQALNALRAAGSALPETPGVLAVSTEVEVEVERREELRETLDGIGALPDRQRAALLAVAVADRSHADVAAELGLSDGALRQLLLRARSALRAAATAITPYPLVTWMASGQDVSATRVAEVAAGAGGAGAAIKAGAVVLAAGAVVAGAPALRDEQSAPAAKRTPAAARHEQAAPSPQPAGALVTTAAARAVQAAPAQRHAAPAAGGGHRSHRGHSGSGDGDDDNRGPSSPSSSSGPGPSRSGSDDSGSGDSGGQRLEEGSHEGEGSGGSVSSGDGASGSGESGSGSSGSDDALQAQPEVTTVPTAPDDNSGEGSGGSGDGGSADGGAHSGGD